MARKWFTLTPNQYYLKPNRKGHRNEVLFAVIGLGLLHFYYWNPKRDALHHNNIESDSIWRKSTVNGAPLIVNPHEKVDIKFLAR